MTPMDDRQIEDLLARYRPADPAAELRERILGDAGAVAAPDGPRAWPWAIAAAALLAVAVGLHVGARPQPPSPFTERAGNVSGAQLLQDDDLPEGMAAFLAASSPARPPQRPAAEWLWPH